MGTTKSNYLDIINVNNSNYNNNDCTNYNTNETSTTTLFSLILAVKRELSNYD